MAAILPVAALGLAAIVLTGCMQQQAPAPVPPPRAASRPQPPDWFHQQLAAARAARRAHQPKADVVGAQQAFDDVMHTACARAALAGPGKYPARCDAVLHPSGEPLVDPCIGKADDPSMQTECSD